MSQDGTKPQIQVKNLWKVFGSGADRAMEDDYRHKSRADIQEELGVVVALRDVSFSVEPGQIFVVMGLSGSGKSTLVRCLMGLIDTTHGEILVDDENVAEFDDEDLISFRRNKVAMVFQHFGLLPHRRVIDNVAFGLEVHGVDKPTRYAKALEAIETVGLSGWENYYPDEMSGGMQQRIGLARALAVNPDILLMDEPFSGLDPLIRREMQDELAMLQTELKKTIVFITHDLNEALKLGDRIAIMRDGVIIQQGTPEEIVSQPADEYVSEFVRDVSRAKVMGAETVMQEPVLVIHDWQGPRVALQLMRANDVEEVFLLGPNRVVRGLLTLDKAAEMVRAQKENCRDCDVEEAITATLDTSIEDLIPLAAETERPIAIVGERGRLLGEVHRGSLLAGMVDSTAEDEDVVSEPV